MQRPRNLLLSGLPTRDFANIEPLLVPVALTYRKQLQSANRIVRDVYFPEDGLASLVAITKGRDKQAEAAVIGNEGMIGFPIVLGTDRSPCDIFMQVEGNGYTMPADVFQDALAKSPALSTACRRFTHVLMVQAFYTALANAQGSLDERLARWLLMAQDRLASSPELLLTHEFLSLMLGVRRRRFDRYANFRTTRTGFDLARQYPHP